jgi:hypothetical protein
VRDDTPIEDLSLSVRAERLLQKAGVKTVEQLRTLDLVKAKLGAKHHRTAITKALAEHDVKREEAKARVQAVRAAFQALSEAERKALLYDLHAANECLCPVVIHAAVRRPVTALGVTIGGFLGGLVADALRDKTKNPEGRK